MTVFEWEVDLRMGKDSRLCEAKQKRYSLGREIEILKYLQIDYPDSADAFQEKIDRLQIQLDSWENFIKNWTPNP